MVYLHERIDFSVSAAGLALSTAMAAGIGGRLLWGVAADRKIAPRRLLGWLGVTMALAAFGAAAITPQWPIAAVLALSFAFGATAVGWNGVYLAEIARIAPRGNAAAITGASLSMTYAGVVVVPVVFWLIVKTSDSYGAAYVAAGLFSLWRGSALFRTARVATAT